jgi:hypothetical protein
VKSAARLLVFLLAIVGAGIACGQAAPAVVGNVVPVTAITLPPVWTPTWNGLPSPVPGWVVLTGTGVELSLPASYQGGDPLTRTQELIDLISQVPGNEDLAELLRTSPNTYRLLAMDESSGSVVAVTVKEIPADVPMPDYVEDWTEAVLDQSSGTSLMEKGIVQFRQQEAGRVLFEFNVADGSSWQLSYVVRREGEIWSFHFASAKDEFYQMQPIFEQSFQTLRFLP